MTAFCLILDCDGVLVDSELIAARVAAQCFVEAGAAVTAAEMLERFAGVRAATVTETVFGERGMAVPEGATDARRATIMAALETDLQPMEGADAALTAIHGPKCVASSSHPDRIAMALRVTGLAHHFGEVFSAVDVEHGKPAPDLFLHAARAMDVAPEHCIVVEDSVAGVLAGKAAGMAVVGFIGGSHCGPGHRDLLLQAGVDRIIHHMRELPAAVVFERATHRI